MLPHSIYQNILQFENLNKQKNLFNFSTTRKGGISEGEYTSLNLGIYAGDNPEYVEKNRQILADIVDIDIDNLYFPYQTHDSNICIINHDFLQMGDLEKYQSLYGIDALITDQQNICIGISTADCVPVLLYDPIQSICAAVHSGWRGTVKRIVQKTINRMMNTFNCNPSDLIAGIAPCISPGCFEVGAEVVRSFKDADFVIEDISFVNEETKKYHTNLWEANKILLVESGMKEENIEIAKMCTYSNSEVFFSARRQGVKSGRMITGLIMRSE